MYEHGDIELKYRGIEPPFCWERIFGNTAPVEIEIGFGKCGFLIDIATDRSLVNFAGIEVSRKYCRKGVKKIQRAEIKNVKLLWGEAFHIFKRCVPEASVANMYINFPDPWPKNRHAKRRLLNAGFVEVAAQKLVPEGCLEIATDVKAYMEEALHTLHVNEHYVQLYYTTSEELENQRQYLSEYEKEFLEEGKTLYYAKYQRK